MGRSVSSSTKLTGALVDAVGVGSDGDAGGSVGDGDGCGVMVGAMEMEGGAVLGADDSSLLSIGA